MDTKTKKKETEDVIVIVTAALLNVRQEPSLKSKIIDVLKKDTKLTVTEAKNGFLKIGDGAGWVKTEYTKNVE